MTALVQASEKRFQSKANSIDHLGHSTVQPLSALELCPITTPYAVAPYEELKLATEADDIVQVGNQLPSIKNKKREGSVGVLEQVAVTGDGTAKNYDHDLMGGKK